MKKTLAITLVVAILASALALFAFAATVTVDFDTEEGQAMGEFFGEGCTYMYDNTDVNVAFLTNEVRAADGSFYNNGIAVKFNSDAAGSAKFTLKLICPDHLLGAYGYKLYHSLNNGDFVTEDLSAVCDHNWFTYEFTADVVAGENVAKFVQGQGDSGNGWRLDIATITIELPEATDEPTEPADSATEPADSATEPGDSATNPTTADASVIAIAAVACVALAGVVVAKKVTKR